MSTPGKGDPEENHEPRLLAVSGVATHPASEGLTTMLAVLSTPIARRNCASRIGSFQVLTPQPLAVARGLGRWNTRTPTRMSLLVSNQFCAPGKGLLTPLAGEVTGRSIRSPHRPSGALGQGEVDGRLTGVCSTGWKTTEAKRALRRRGPTHFPRTTA